MTLTQVHRSTRKLLEAISAGETVTLTKRGKVIARVIPSGKEATPEDKERFSIRDDNAFGIWKDREDMTDPVAYSRKIRQPRYMRQEGAVGEGEKRERSIE